ncbi:MAG TPA: glycosyltransferase family 2 protein [Solirubrobacteraceae bacterium]
MSSAEQSLQRLAPVPRLMARRLLRGKPAERSAATRAAAQQLPAGLSVVMAAHNEQDTIEACLAHLAGLAEEIVVLDAASSDDTAAIAARYTERVIETSNKPMLEINKNIAMAAATRRWVFVLDPDERLSPDLAREIRAVVERDDERIAGYWMPRRNYILGRWVRTMGMYPGSQLRLVRNGEGRFSEREHHLPMAVDGPVGYLGGDLVHLSDATVAEILSKRTRYAEFAARQMHERGVRFRARRLVSEPARSFLTQYLLLGGLLEGATGLIYAGLSAYGALLRHARLWELERDARRRSG